MPGAIQTVHGKEWGRPALRLVQTRQLSRPDWLAVRKTALLGGTDA